LIITIRTWLQEFDLPRQVLHLNGLLRQLRPYKDLFHFFFIFGQDSTSFQIERMIDIVLQ